ncbi:MAG: hypothetical protein DRH10_00255 [Deltaproteobacteria bacterium]|nr:MAG: hypothetical protein DRH10_00255 [Deltaproteobacteria bacterium]RLC09448.1 MAG: hypothetical protein DRH43_08270 [Deltaproteobacteria bacterium]
MKYIIIGIALLTGITGIILARLNVFKKEEKQISHGKLQPFERFCSEHGFQLLQGQEEADFRKKVRKFTRTGFLADLFKSLTPTDQYAARMNKGVTEYVIHQFAVHQSGGYIRHLYGVFVDRHGLPFPEILITPTSPFAKMMKVVRKGDKWSHFESKGPFEIYVRGDLFAKSAPNRLARCLTRLGKPFLSLHAGSEGILVYFQERNRRVENDFDYERLLQAAHTLNKSL